MIENTIISSMLNRRSVRKYKSDKPSDDVVNTIVRAGQQAPFASQLYSILLTRKKKAPFELRFGSSFVWICINSNAS